MLLDLANGMVGEILVELGDDPALYVRMERSAQIRQRARRRDHYQRLRFSLAHERLHGACDSVHETMLLEIVPVRVFHCAAQIGAGALERAAGPIAALLMGRGVLVLEDPLGLEVGKFLVALVAKKSALRPSPTNTNASWGIRSL